MEKLSDIRPLIDEIDKQLLDLFLKRMQLSQRVANVKLVTGDSIYKPEREDEVIENITKGLTQDQIDKCEYVKSYFKNIMQLSRQLQYHVLSSNSCNTSIAIDKAPNISLEKKPNTVYIQGTSGAYSHIATKEIFGDNLDNIEHCPLFLDVFKAVQVSENSVGVIPLQNSTAGSVDEVYDLLLQHNLYITKVYDLDIRHCLCSIKGARIDTITTIFSHPQALSQCKNFIDDNKFNVVAQQNTAVCAKNVAQMNDKSAGVICSYEAAMLNGLDIICENITNVSQNQTKFIVVSKDLSVRKSDKKIRIVFKTDHQSGALSSVLSAFSSYNINLTHIYSRPATDDLWSFSFYVEFDGNLLDPKIQTLLHHLNEELKMIRILGNY